MSVEDDTPKTMWQVVKSAFEADGAFDALSEHAYWVFIAAAPALAAFGYSDQHEHAAYLGMRKLAPAFLTPILLFMLFPLLVYVGAAFRRQPPKQPWMRALIIFNGPFFAGLALVLTRRLDFSAFFWEGLVDLAALSSGFALSEAKQPRRKRADAIDVLEDWFVLFMMGGLGPVAMMLLMFESWWQAVVVLPGYGFGTWMFSKFFDKEPLRPEPTPQFHVYRNACVVALVCAVTLELLIASMGR